MGQSRSFLGLQSAWYFWEMSQVLQLLPPMANTIQFRPNYSSPPLLVLSAESIRLNCPDGSPMIEARADGAILVRGEQVATHPHKEIYESFVKWVKECCGAAVKPPQPPLFGKSLLAHVLPLLRAQNVLDQANDEFFRRTSEDVSYGSSVPDDEGGEAADRG